MIDENLIKIAIPLIVAVITWLSKDRILHALNIKKEEKVIESSQLDNVQKALDLWQEMLNDVVQRNKAQVQELEAIIERLKIDFAELKDISDKKDLLIKEQRELIAKQSKSIKYYQDKYEKI